MKKEKIDKTEIEKLIDKLTNDPVESYIEEYRETVEKIKDSIRKENWDEAHKIIEKEIESWSDGIFKKRNDIIFLISEATYTNLKLWYLSLLADLLSYLKKMKEEDKEFWKEKLLSHLEILKSIETKKWKLLWGTVL
jgi:Glu-tRNA(Gln) amidotransferase subunit E-like FAD-binding protein